MKIFCSIEIVLILCEGWMWNEMFLIFSVYWDKPVTHTWCVVFVTKSSQCEARVSFESIQIQRHRSFLLISMENCLQMYQNLKLLIRKWNFKATSHRSWNLEQKSFMLMQISCWTLGSISFMWRLKLYSRKSSWKFN